MAVVVAVTAVSTAQTPSLLRSLPIAQHGLVEPLLLLGLILWLRPGWAGVVVLLGAMGASVALASIFSLTRMLLRVAQTLAAFEAERTQLSRLVYYNVGIFGDLLTMALPLLLAWLLLRRQWPHSRLWTALAGAAIAISIGCVYLTFSKSAWLGSIIACAGMLIVTTGDWRRRGAIVVISAALISFVIPYPAVLLRAVSPGMAATYNQIVNNVNSRADTIDPNSPEGEVSVTERLYASEAALRMAADHPLIGVGPGSFAAAYQSTYRRAGATRALDSAHDLLPYLAAEFGLIVAAIVALGLLTAVLFAAQVYLRAPPEDQFARIGSAAVGAAIIGFVIVATTFGVDLYRPYRLMNSDVMFASALVAVGLLLPGTIAGRTPGSEAAGPRDAVPPPGRVGHHGGGWISA
ncbi:MAG: O-antigen ligase domain-containing protein [Chloroflexota bacterium]|nr:MAG: O-antigen ligase domain-containing protein [Chloroflexota bacterium]